MLKLFNSKLVTNSLLLAQNVRPFYVCSTMSIKNIEKTIDKEKNLITIEGKYLEQNELDKDQPLPLTSTNRLELVSKNSLKADQEVDHDSTRPCAFCELEKKDILVQYYDVLILRQFLTDDGIILPRKVTGLCRRQNIKLMRLVKLAKISGLLLNLQPKLIDGSGPDTNPRNRYQHLKWNTYFDEYEKMVKTKKYI